MGDIKLEVRSSKWEYFKQGHKVGFFRDHDPFFLDGSLLGRLCMPESFSILSCLSAYPAANRLRLALLFLFCFPMQQHERAATTLCNEIRADNGLAESWRR